MKNVVQEILNNLGRAQTIHKTKPSQGDLQQSRTKYTGECEEAPPFGGTGIGGR